MCRRGPESTSSTDLWLRPDRLDNPTPAGLAFHLDQEWLDYKWSALLGSDWTHNSAVGPIDGNDNATFWTREFDVLVWGAWHPFT